MKKTIKPIRHFFRRAPVHNRVVIICVLLALFSMLIIGGYLSAVMYSKAYDSTYDKSRVYTDKTVQNIDQSFSFITNTALAVATGGTVGYWINDTTLFDPHNPSYYTNINNLKSETAHVLTYSNAWKTNYISYICILSDDKPLLYVCRNQMTPNSIYESAMQANNLLKAREDNFIGDVPPIVNENEIYHIRVMKRDFASPDSLSIIIATNESVLFQEYAQFDQENQGSTFLIDDTGYVFSSSQREMVGEKCNEKIIDAIQERDDGNVWIDGEEYLYFSKPLSANSLRLVNMVPKSSIMAQTLEGLPFMLVIAAVLCLFLLVAGYIVSFKSTAFIKDLVVCMDEVRKKNYDTKMPRYHNRSVDDLSRHFNNMTAAMKTLINDTYKAKIMRQEMELEFIQQQVNPHFLFNVLSTIQIKAKMCGDETIYQMLTSLSGLLRASLYSGKNTMTTLAEEIKCTEFYLYLQKQRYCQRLDYTITMQPDLGYYQIPRLTIEPIVENSVIHGMENASEPVHIRVQILRNDEDILIRVKDDGRGFDTRSLDLNREEVTLENSREKIGLKNTHNRLILYYGEEYGLQVHSVPGKGTIVELRIPLEQKGNAK